MLRIFRSVEIGAKPAVVWTILTKHLEHPEYHEKANATSPRIRGSGGTPLTPRRAGVGVRTRWTYEFRGRSYSWDDEVTAWEEGRRIAWKAISAWTMLDSFELTPTAAGTRVVYDMVYKFPYGPLGWLVARLAYHNHIEQSINETLHGLKSAAEALATLNRDPSTP